MVSVLRYAGQGVVYLGIAVLFGIFSQTPVYRHFPSDQAQIKVSVVHSAERKEACRRLSAQEIAELAPNMRKALACSRERLPVRLELVLDGTSLIEESLPPTGLSSDGPAKLYRGLTVEPGPHHLVLRMRDSARSEGYDYHYDGTVELAPQQNLVVDFRAEAGGFVLR